MPTLKLEAATASKLIELLSSDDGFRELFAKDTLAALEKLGQARTPELEAFVVECCAKIELASKETIADAREEIMSMLTVGGNYSVPMLDANQPKNRPLK